MNYSLITVGILFFSTFASWLLIWLKYADKTIQVKWILFVLFFWLLNFLQLIVLAFYYQLNY